MIERYELPGRSWVNPDDLTEEMCDEVSRAVELIYDAVCEHISLDENPDIDHELRVLYIGVKYLHLQPKTVGVESAASKSVQLEIDKLRFSISNAREDLANRTETSVADARFMGAVLDNLDFRINAVCRGVTRLPQINDEWKSAYPVNVLRSEYKKVRRSFFAWLTGRPPLWETKLSVGTQVVEYPVNDNQ